MLKLDCRKWPGPMTTRALAFAIGEFEAVVGADPQAIVMRPEQHDAIADDWSTDTCVPHEAELFIREEVSDTYGRVGHFQMIPIHLREG